MYISLKVHMSVCSNVCKCTDIQECVSIFIFICLYVKCIYVRICVCNTKGICVYVYVRMS